MGFPASRLRITIALALLWAVALAGGVTASTAADWRFRAWQTDEGLPDNSVTGIVQTQDGYLWVGTRGGLMRFNGAKFTASPLLHQPEVLDRVVRGLILDRRGRLWVGLGRGQVMCLDAEGVRTFGPEEGLPGSFVNSMAEDAEGNVWVAYFNGLIRIRDGVCENFGEDAGFPPGTSETRLVCDAKGELWYAHRKTVGVFRDGKLQPKVTVSGPSLKIGAAASSGLWICDGSRVLRYREGEEPEEAGRLPENVVPQVLFEDRSGALWIGTGNDGLFRLAEGVVEKVPTSQEEIDCLFEDREGNLWAGTNGGGLNQIRRKAMVLIDREAGLPADSVRSVCEDSAGGLWAVLQNGMLARSRNDRWARVEASGAWPGEGATCVAADQEGGVWVCSRDGSLFHFGNGEWRTWGPKDGLVRSAVRSVLGAGDGSVWVATDSPRRLHQISSGKFRSIKMPTGLSGIRAIRAMAEGADGTIWIGTAGGEVMRVEGSSLVTEPAISETRPDSIRTLHATPDGALWIGYAGGGIGRFKDGAYGVATTDEGLMDDFVSQILADGKGAMWMTGNHGLFQVGLEEIVDVTEGRVPRLRSRVFGRAEGLAGLQPSFDYSPAACRGRDGRLWFAMRNGLLMVMPDKVRDNPEPPPVVIERVFVDDQVVALYDRAFQTEEDGKDALPELRLSADALRLGPGHTKVEFDFAALSFSSPENVHFRYRLEGFDRKWIDADNEHHASYPQLPAGNYEFRVIACNNSGLWNETGAALAVAVAPFYWQTWWFRMLALTGFTAGVIAIVRYVSFRRLRVRMLRLKQEAALHQERARIARDMHDEVGAKLTRLSLLSEMVDDQADLTPAAKAEVREISDTARETILAFDEIVWAVNPRNDTLGDLTHYLCRYAEDFFDGTPTECVFELPKVIPPLMLSTEVRHQVFLAAKEALNNIMKHAHASEVRISLILHAGTFELVIEDDGQGFDPAAPDPRTGGGNGLENLLERMQGVGGRFDCHSKPGHGSRVSFTVPLS